MYSKFPIPMAILALTASAYSQLAYPDTPKGDTVDNYFGTKVPDPYRWLEDANSAETKNWVQAENKVTFAYLNDIPERAQIRKRFGQVLNYERFGMPFKKGGKYFFTRNDGLQNQSVLFVSNSLKGTPRRLIDPNVMSKGGVDPIGGYSVSEDGKHIVYSKSLHGSDWNEFHVRDVKTGKDLPDVIKWVKFSGASWSKDGKGFYYSTYDEPKAGHELQSANYYHKLYYHRLGTKKSEDKIIFQKPDQKEWNFGGDVTEDGRYLIIGIWYGKETNRVYYKDLKAKGNKIVKLLDKDDAAYDFIANNGPIFWFQTDKMAPNKKIIAIDIRKPQQVNWKTVIPESKDALQGINVTGNHFIAEYLHDAHTQIEVHSLAGKLTRVVKLLGLGTASGFGGKKNDNETFYTYTSYTSPTTVYRYDVATGKSTVFRKPKVPIDVSKFTTEQVFYRSEDGTRVPMFITHKKGMKLDGANPTILYGYGGFGISQTPYFSTITATWLEMGGVWCVANIRGGGEYGKSWHDAARKTHRQKAYDDFIAAAEYLIANQYTSTPKLAIEGGSNGGLLVGACMTQRPELFGACLPAVGVMDLLRYQKFTIGWAWASDYGTSDNEKEFDSLIKISPYHNIRPGTSYPPTLVTTADHDDRVVPAHSFKFISALQAAQAGSAPVLIRIETQSGHGTASLSKALDETADAYAFLVKNLNVTVPAGFGS